MRQVALIVGFSALACLLFMGAYPSTSGAVSHAIGFETADQSLVVNVKKDKNDDDDDEKPKKEKKANNCKKARCEPGMFVLDKPNIYGACCQAGAEPLKPKTTPAEAEKCKFPGEVGTPPNCKCPDGTEFMGYKGCVKQQRVCCEGFFPDGKSTGRDCGAPEAAVRKITASARHIGDPTPPGNITCAPEK
jgi:hypothetical protein